MKQIVSNMTGSVFQIHVKEGDNVQEGDQVVILESMKMEIPIEADQEGTVKEIKVEVGQFVNEGDVLLMIE